MNRLSAPSPPPASSTAVARAERPALRSRQWNGFPHSLVAPLHYERNYSYPLVVWLHSTGGDEREVQQVMPLVSLRNYAALAVRGPMKERAGYSWPQTADTIAAAEHSVLEGISRARERFNIHSERIFIAGYEAGGTMAVRLALRHPQHFAGAVSLNGSLPEGFAPLARFSEAREVKLLVAHCRDSQAYPLDRVCQDLSLLHTAAIPLTLRQYPCDDELTTQMLRDMDVWLMQQVTGVSSPDDGEPALLPSDWN